MYWVLCLLGTNVISFCTRVNGACKLAHCTCSKIESDVYCQSKWQLLFRHSISCVITQQVHNRSGFYTRGRGWPWNPPPLEIECGFVTGIKQQSCPRLRQNQSEKIYFPGGGHVPHTPLVGKGLVVWDSQLFGIQTIKSSY